MSEGLSEEQKQALEEQKKQCVFCKIIAGEIPSQTVYEDDEIIAILDINPLSKGHILVMPKEHYPIMPLIPYETFTHLFRRTRELCTALKNALLMTGTTIHIANGQVAGQVSPHFMLHIIPREEGDAASIFGTQGNASPPDEELVKALSHNLFIMVENHLKKHPVDWHTPQEEQFGKDQVISIIEQNPQLKEYMVQKPDEFIEQIGANEQLSKLFSQVDPVEVIQHFNPQYSPGVRPQGDTGPGSPAGGGGTTQDTDSTQSAGAGEPVTGTDESPQDTGAPGKPQPDEDTADRTATVSGNGAGMSTQQGTYQHEPPAAPDHNWDELIHLIDNNPKFKQMLLEDPEGMKQRIRENSDLHAVFGNTSIDALYRFISQRERGPPEQVKQVIEQNPRLKELIMNDPDALKQKIEKVPEIARLFEGLEVEAIIQYYQESGKTHEDDVQGDEESEKPDTTDDHGGASSAVEAGDDQQDEPKDISDLI